MYRSGGVDELILSPVSHIVTLATPSWTKKLYDPAIATSRHECHS